MPSPNARRDDGFTLVEMLVGMAITAMLIGVIGTSLVVGLRTTDATTKRLSESHDVQITSSYLANDVQSAASVTVASGSGNCGGSGTPTTLITFTYYNSAGTSTYSCGRSASGETRVLRTFGPITQVLAHFAGTARPTIACTPSPCTSTPLRTVTITFTQASGGSYTLVGSRRTYSASGGSGSQSVPPLTLLATGSSPIWISGGCTPGQINNGQCIDDPDTPNSNDAPSLTVRGNLYVNSSLNNAVKLTGKKNVNKLTINNGGAFKILSPGGCTGCTQNTVTCVACTWVTNQLMWSSYSPALTDPLANMSDPTSATTGSCSGNVCTPGVYASRLSLNSNSTFQPGIYIFRQGMQVTGNASLTGSGVMFFIGANDLSLGGGAAVNLTPPTSGTYKNILIFQARANTSTLKITGGSSATLTFGGVIYAPASNQVTLSTGGAALNVTAVVAQNIKIASSAQVTVG